MRDKSGSVPRAQERLPERDGSRPKSNFPKQVFQKPVVLLLLQERDQCRGKIRMVRRQECQHHKRHSLDVPRAVCQQPKKIWNSLPQSLQHVLVRCGAVFRRIGASDNGCPTIKHLNQCNTIHPNLGNKELYKKRHYIT